MIDFTPEQLKEIRRRIEDAYAHKQDILAAFPLPKVTRYRTFESSKTLALGSNGTYRVSEGRVEYCSRGLELSGWVVATDGDSVARFAARLIGLQDWTALAALADVAARPTEEVDG